VLTAIRQSHKLVLFRNKKDLENGVETNFDLLFHNVDFLQVPFKFHLESIRTFEVFNDNRQNIELKLKKGLAYIKCFRVSKQENTLPIMNLAYQCIQEIMM